MRSPRRRTSVAAAAVLCGVGLAGAAAAQEYCVACTGPDAVYRCTIDQASPTGMPLKMLCVSTLAKEGGHATCAVRGGTVFDCNGPIRRIDAKAVGAALPRPPVQAPPAAGAALPPTAGADGAKQQAGPPQPPKPAPGPESEPPKTVEELAKRVGKSSGESLGKAGSTISDQTSKAWRCLTSLFKSC